MEPTNGFEPPTSSLPRTLYRLSYMGGGMGLILRKAFQSRLCYEYVKQNDWKMVTAYIDAIFEYRVSLSF